jgi:hypothetical protein
MLIMKDLRLKMLVYTNKSDVSLCNPVYYDEISLIL